MAGDLDKIFSAADGTMLARFAEGLRLTSPLSARRLSCHGPAVPWRGRSAASRCGSGPCMAEPATSSPEHVFCQRPEPRRARKVRKNPMLGAETQLVQPRPSSTLPEWRVIG